MKRAQINLIMINLLNVNLVLLNLFIENFSITLGLLQEAGLEKIYSN